MGTGHRLAALLLPSAGAPGHPRVPGRARGSLRRRGPAHARRRAGRLRPVTRETRCGHHRRRACGRRRVSHVRPAQEETDHARPFTYPSLALVVDARRSDGRARAAHARGAARRPPPRHPFPSCPGCWHRRPPTRRRHGPSFQATRRRRRPRQRPPRRHRRHPHSRRMPRRPRQPRCRLRPHRRPLRPRQQRPHRRLRRPSTRSGAAARDTSRRHGCCSSRAIAT